MIIPTVTAFGSAPGIITDSFSNFRQPYFPTKSRQGLVCVSDVTVQSANCRLEPFGNSEKVTILYRNQEDQILGRMWIRSL